jgi:hypothetical protein
MGAPLLVFAGTKTKLYTPWYVVTPSMIDTCPLGQTWLSVG